MRGGTTTKPYDPYPEIRERINENPARFLWYCEQRRVTSTVVGLLRGMSDRQRLDDWETVAVDLFDERSKPARFVRARREFVFGDRDDTPLDGDAETVATPATRAEDRDGDSTSTPPGTDDPAVESGADPESTSAPISYATEEDYQNAVDRAMSTARMLDDVDELRDRLADECDADEPREHVIEALELRLGELGASVADSRSGVTYRRVRRLAMTAARTC